ncbi:hypothetical protein ACLESO_25995, partial [Pyxidicoccus sp. 3LG]
WHAPTRVHGPVPSTESPPGRLRSSHIPSWLASISADPVFDALVAQGKAERVGFEESDQPGVEPFLSLRTANRFSNRVAI